MQTMNEIKHRMNYDRERNRYTARPSNADVCTVDGEYFEETGALLFYSPSDVRRRGLPHWRGGLQSVRLSTRTLQDYRDSGTIAYCKIGGKILYKQSDIQAMLERHYNPISKKP